MRLLREIVAVGCLVAALSGPAQTVRFSGRVQTGQPYLRAIVRRLVLEVTTEGIAVRPLSGAAGDNYAACATPPAHGPNSLDIEGWHFDPARSEGAPGLRREFQFALTARSDKMECRLAEALYRDDQVPGYRAQRLGSGVLTLSDVKLSASGEEVASFRFVAAVKLPRKR